MAFQLKVKKYWYGKTKKKNRRWNRFVIIVTSRFMRAPERLWNTQLERKCVQRKEKAESKKKNEKAEREI